MRGHAPDLPVAPFGDGDAQPVIRHRFAEPHRRVAGPERIRFGNLCDLSRPGWSVFERDASCQQLYSIRLRRALHLHKVCFGHFVLRARDPCLQAAIVSQDHQPLAVQGLQQR